MCEKFVQKQCSQSVDTICFTRNWGNLNQRHISSKWQLVIMNVIFSAPSRDTESLQYPGRGAALRSLGQMNNTQFTTAKCWTITISYIQNYDNFVGVLYLHKATRTSPRVKRCWTICSLLADFPKKPVCGAEGWWLGAGQWTEDARVAGQGARARQYSAALTEPCLAECGRGHVEPVPWPALHSPAADIGSVTFDARVPGPALINGNTTFFSPRVLFWSPHRCIIVNKCPYSGDTLYHVLQFYIDTAINTQYSERRQWKAIGTSGSIHHSIDVKIQHWTLVVTNIFAVPDSRVTQNVFVVFTTCIDAAHSCIHEQTKAENDPFNFSFLKNVSENTFSVWR